MNNQEGNFTVRAPILEVHLPSRIDFMISNFFAKVLAVKIESKVELLLFDFRKTTFVTLPGALYILGFSIIFYGRSNRRLTIQIIGINENVMRFFMSIGMISKLSNRAGLQTIVDTINEERRVIDSKLFSQNSIIYPITSIEYSSDKSYFGGYTKGFVDSFSTFFYSLIKYPIYNYTNNLDDFQEMYQAVYEIIKNIFDHCEAEGFGAIHASSLLKGTTIAFFDTGIGIAKSVLNADVNAGKSDIEAIEWALIDGNSSKKNAKNQGHGLTILRDFCDIRSGILTVRTGSYLNVYTNKRWTHKSVGYFPGTQIVIYNPTIKQ